MDSFENEGFWRFYFTSPLRMLITIPLFLIIGVNLVYHMVLGPFFYIDFFLGFGDTNPILWFILFFVSPFQWAIYGIPITIATIPLVALPLLWHTPKIWGIAKIVIFVVGMTIATVVANLATLMGFGLINALGGARLSLWWAELWGVMY